ncbi:heavy metal translocating P-type ATPase [Paraliobacillus quinghaiensis]|nr:heavy metal translocating P-type ATPase [Paraliobacillus quinghaiensis]
MEPLFKNNYMFFLKKHGELIAALLSGIIILTAWILEDKMPNSLWITSNLIAFVIGGFAKAKEGITNSIIYKELNVELLMIFAAIGSAIIGYWTEGAILIFIFALSGALETYTMQKSERELSALMDIQPEQALRLIHNKTELVDVEDLVIGDYILIKPGERIPADGIITKGKSSVDESALTGESIPATKQCDAEVYAGTVNLNGSLTVKISKLSKDSFVQKIMELVQSAQSEKSPSQLFIERFESKYVKIVLITVGVMLFLPHFLFGWSWTDTIYRAMILLVVASPCALVASIMPATLSAISNAARNGILFKGGVHIENLSNVKAIALDKTGTLTNGTPHVTDIHFAKEIDEHYALQVINAIEKESTHPLAQAIVNYTKEEQRRSDLLVENMQEEVGKGVSATIDGDNWVVGSGNFFNQRSDADWYNAIAEKLATEAKTVVYIAKNNEVVGLIALKDDVRNDTIKAIQSFKKAGIHTIMLTGDNETTAQAIAEEAQLDGYIANCMPADKVTEIKKLKEKYTHVAMIGDGINDAPALATADIGIAMGAGTDVALETADIILIKNKLKKITNAIQLSTRMNRIVKQNIFFSISVICVLIITNFFQLLDLPLGVLGHEGSTILVILNGLRLLR